MPLTRREKQGYATAATGVALTAGGAQVSEAGINRGLKAAKMKRPTFGVRKPYFGAPGFTALARSHGKVGGGKAKTLYATGNTMRLLGTGGVLAGGSQAYRSRKYRLSRVEKGVITEGIKGNFSALKERGENLKEKKPLGSMLMPAAIGAGATGLGSTAGHLAVNAARKNSKARPAVAAVGGLAGLGASLPMSNAALKQRYPEYKLTPAGVTRRKKAPVRPSTRAAHFDQRAGKAAFRRGTVPSDVRKADYPGQNMTRGQKRATILGAGAIPGVGDVLAAGAAGKLAPPDQKKRAVATQLTGSLGGSLLGAAAGGAVAGELARSNSGVQERLVNASKWVDSKKAGVKAPVASALKPVTDMLPKRAEGKPSALNAAKSTLNKVPGAPKAGKLMATAIKPIKGRYGGALGVAAGAGALGGQIAGGQAGSNAAITRNLNRESKSSYAVAKALLVINQGQKVDRKANQAAARRKKFSGAMSTTGGAVGTAAFGMMAAAKRPSLARKYPKLADQARDVGLVGGGIGGANALYFGRLQRKEAKELVKERSTPSTQKVYKSETIRRHARHGQANVRLKTLEPYRRAPGLRWKNSAHTAEIAQHIKRQGYDKTKPVHVQLWNGREVFIDDGAHRMWAADMAGRKTVPIKITQHTGRNPRRSSGALNRTFDDVRTARFHTQRRRTTNLSDAQLKRLAARKATGWQARQNAKWSARGEARANSRGRLVAMT